MYQTSALRAKSQRVMEMLDRQIDRLKQYPMNFQPHPIAKPPVHRRRGDNATIILAALVKHHDYDGTGIVNPEWIDVRELATVAGVSPATVSRWFKERFTNGHDGYKVRCRAKHIFTDLRLLTGDYSPRVVDLADHEKQQRVSRRNRQDETGEAL